MTALEVLECPADQLPGDAVGVFYFVDQQPLAGPGAVLDWRLSGRVTRDLLDGKLSGRAGEHALYQNNGRLAAAWALFVGGGHWQGLSSKAYGTLIGHLLQTAGKAGLGEISLCLAIPEDVDGQDIIDLVDKELRTLQAPFKVCRLVVDRESTI